MAVETTSTIVEPIVKAFDCYILLMVNLWNL